MRPLFAAAAALSLLPGYQAAQDASAEAKLRDAVHGYFSALAKKDIDAAMAAWSTEAAQRPDLKEFLSRMLKHRSDILTSDLQITHLAFKDDFGGARISFKGHGTAEESDQFPDEARTVWSVTFRREGSEWKWWYQEPAAKGFALALDAAPDKAARAKLLEEERGLITIRLLVILREVAQQHLSVRRTDHALKVSDAGIEAAESVGRKDLGSMAQLNRGLVFRILDRWQEATEAFRSALSSADLSGDRFVAAEAGALLGDCLGELRRHDEAAARLEEALELVHKDEKLGGLASTVEYCAGMAARSRGDTLEAARRFAQSRDSARRRGQRTHLAAALYELGSVLFELGDLGGALKECEEGLRTAPAEDFMTRGRLLRILVLVHAQCHEFRESLHRLEEAYALLEKSGDRKSLVILCGDAGNIYFQQGFFEKAAEFFGFGLDFAEKTGDVRNANRARNNLGLVNHLKGDLEGALKAYRRCLDDLEKHGDDKLRAGLLFNIASVHLEQSQFDEALSIFGKALEVAKSVHSPLGEYYSHMGIGSALMGRAQPRDLESAVEAFERAICHIEATRTGLQVPGIQQAYLSVHSSVFVDLARAHSALTRGSEAFGAAERGKARSLVDILSGGRVIVQKAMTQEEQTREERLMSDVNALTRQLEIVRGSTDEQDKLKDRIGERWKALEEFRRAVFLRHPELQTYRGRFLPATLEEIQAGLFARNPKLRVLSYLVGADEVLLFVLSPGRAEADVKVLRIPYSRKDLEMHAREFWAQCSQAGEEYRKRGRTLYESLVAPAEKDGLLKDAEHLLIVPDGILHALPFAALIDAGGTHLVEKHTLSFAPSVTALLKLKALAQERRGQAGTVPLLAVGDPVMPPGFTQLKGAKADVERVARLFGDPKAGKTGKDATEKYVKQEIGKARFVHLATHGKYDEASPMYSFIVLGADGANDGFLQARELVDLDLRADLVVLSACETGRGKTVSGEGIVGLTWALLVAGTRSCVVTHWQVADTSTSDLMETFYAAMKAPGARVSRAKALREAQLKLMKKEGHAHPYSWAPFVLVGDWED